MNRRVRSSVLETKCQESTCRPTTRVWVLLDAGLWGKRNSSGVAGEKNKLAYHRNVYRPMELTQRNLKTKQQNTFVCVLCIVVAPFAGKHKNFREQLFF